MKQFIIILTLSLLSIYVYAQQNHIALHSANSSYYNPATTGLNNQHNATVIGQKQYYGITNHYNGNPSFLNALYEFRGENMNSGFGIDYRHYSSQFHEMNAIQLKYAYHIAIGEKSTLSAGAYLEYKQMDINYTRLGMEADPILAERANYHGTYFNTGLGLTFQNENLYIGLSTINLTSNKKQEAINTQYYTGSVMYTLNKDKAFQYTPSLMAFTDFNSAEYRLGFLTEYKKLAWISPHYIVSTSLGCSAGINLFEKFGIAYSYEHAASKLKRLGAFKHELGFSYKIGR